MVRIVHTVYVHIAMYIDVMHWYGKVFELHCCTNILCIESIQLCTLDTGIGAL